MYGDEIRGPDRLGSPVPYQPALGKPAEQLNVNTQLEARFRALQHVVLGLAHYWSAEHDKAATEFQDVIDDSDWDALDGKEVIHLLLGAVQLRQYDSAALLAQRTESLTDARTSFAKAYELNPDYARSYLGLGATALQQALLDPQEQTDQVDAKLSEAYGWYTRTLMSQGFPGAAHLDTKAAYGLGQTLFAWPLASAARLVWRADSSVFRSGAGCLSAERPASRSGMAGWTRRVFVGLPGWTQRGLADDVEPLPERDRYSRQIAQRSAAIAGWRNTGRGLDMQKNNGRLLRLLAMPTTRPSSFGRLYFNRIKKRPLIPISFAGRRPSLDYKCRIQQEVPMNRVPVVIGPLLWCISLAGGLHTRGAGTLASKRRLRLFHLQPTSLPLRRQ